MVKMAYFGPPQITWSKLENTHPPIWLPVFIQSDSPLAGATEGGGIPIRRSSVKIISSLVYERTYLMSGGFVGRNGSIYGTVGTLWMSFFTVLTIRLSLILSKKPIFFISCNVCYLNFYISSKPWFYTFLFNHFLVGILVTYFMILQLQQLHGTEYAIMCWCAVKKLLTHSLIHCLMPMLLNSHFIHYTQRLVHSCYDELFAEITTTDHKREFLNDKSVNTMHILVSDARATSHQLHPRTSLY